MKFGRLLSFWAPVAVFGFLLMSSLVFARPHQDLAPTGSQFAKSYDQWIDQNVRWIITDSERADFAKLSTDQQRDEFIHAFWERRNSAPGLQENRFKEEHYRRLAYANRHFADRDPGWKTDRGRIYIVYGPPDEIEAHPVTAPDGAGGLTFPNEVWLYRSLPAMSKGMSFRFVDSCRCGEYRLLPEHR